MKSVSTFLSWWINFSNVFVYLLNKTGLDLQEVTRKCLVDEAIYGHLLEVGSVQPLLIEKIRIWAWFRI